MGPADVVPFDSLAAEYDDNWTFTPSGLQQRKAVWKAITPYFYSRTNVLDIGAGTGVDATFLQSLGVRVYAIDSSSAMVQVALRRGVEAHVSRIEDLGKFSHVFDGAISNFGPLNCISSLETFAASLACLLKTGAPVAICILGRVCLWESIFYVLTGNWKKAFRRFRGIAQSSLGIAVRYPSDREVRLAFSKQFQFARWQGIGLFVPPSYVPISAKMARCLAHLDRLAAGFPFFRALSDHRLYLFQRL
jgi:SAM-dependent methyltransferase